MRIRRCARSHTMVIYWVPTTPAYTYDVIRGHACAYDAHGNWIALTTRTPTPTRFFIRAEQGNTAAHSTWFPGRPTPTTYLDEIYATDDPVNRSDPTGMWWCLPKGHSGPCPAGYTRKPPYGMTFPQPPASNLSPQPNGNYLLTMADGERFTFTSGGNVVGGEGPPTAKAPCCNPNSPTTNQEWNAYLGAGFLGSGGAIVGAELAGAGIDGLQAASEAYAAGEVGGAALAGAAVASGGLIIVGGVVVVGTGYMISHFF